MELMKHQMEAAQKAYEILIKYGLVYIFGQPRVGKSLISLQVVKDCQLLKEGKCIVFTKKNAINDWLKYQEDFDFDITNYERVVKFDANDYEYVIIDEAHNFGAFPKPSQRVKDMRAFCANKVVIFLSGTPFVEGALKAYHQFNLSSHSPFRHIKTGYEFFRQYGIENKIYVSGRSVESYSKCKTEAILKIIDPYLVKVTYEDAGFTYQNEDEIVLLDGDRVYDLQQSAIYNRVASDDCDIDEWQAKDGREGYWYDPLGTKYPLENISALCQYLHRLCGGFYQDMDLDWHPKVEWLEDYVNEHKGEKIAIMCYFIEEQKYFQEFFKFHTKVVVFSSTKYCEGVDLSDFDRYILYSFGYSGSKFIQLRDRIVNLNKDKKTKVIIPLLDSPKGDLFDAQVYAAVKNKQNFNTKTLGNLFDQAFKQ